MAVVVGVGVAGGDGSGFVLVFLLQWVVVAMMVVASGVVGEVAVCRFFGCFFNIIFMSCLYYFR